MVRAPEGGAVPLISNQMSNAYAGQNSHALCDRHQSLREFTQQQ